MADIRAEQSDEQDTELSEVLALYAPLLAGLRQASPVDRQISLLVDEAVGVWSRPGFDTFLSVASLRFTPFDYQLQAARSALRRMRGRAILADEVGLGKTIEAGLILAELRLQAQLEKLLVVSTLRNVELGVVPFGVLLETDARHGFWIMDDRLVIVETYAAELRLTDPGDLVVYGRIFEQMTQVAVYGDQARRLISHVARTLPPSADTSRAREDRPSSGNASNS